MKKIFSHALLSVVVVLSCTFCAMTKSGFHDDPRSDFYRAFKENESKEVSPESIENWLNASTTSGPYRRAPYIIVEAIIREPNAYKRASLVDYYLNLYNKIKNNDIPPLQNSVLYPDWSEGILPNEERYALRPGHFRGVPKGSLRDALEKQKRRQRELRYLNDLQNLVSRID